MYKIDVVDEEGKALFTYKSSILPIVGDNYAGLIFQDNLMRTVVNRLLFTFENCNSICIYTKITHPNLIK